MPRVITSRPLLALTAIAACAAFAGCGEQPPRPKLVVSSGGQVRTGQDVTITDANPSTDGADPSYSWDLDGDGRFETRLGYGFSEYITTKYATPGTRDVSVDVSKPVGTWGLSIDVHGSATTQVTVTAPPATTNPPANQPPVARFSTDATPGYTERQVAFDASGSSDDGQIVKYEWDWTGDGSYDATTTTPATKHAYDAAGDYDAVLRVTDDKGLTATTHRAVPVQDGVPPVGLAGSGALAAARSGTPFQTTLTGKVVKPGTSYLNGGTLFQAGLTAQGRMKLTDLPKPLNTKRSARWAAAFVVKQHGSSADTRIKVEGYLLLDFGHRDRLCLSGSGAGSATSAATGRLGVVGGSGLASRLRGAATFAVPPEAKSINGRLTFAKTRKAIKLPKACRTLVRVLNSAR